MGNSYDFMKVVGLLNIVLGKSENTKELLGDLQKPDFFVRLG